MLLGGEVGGGLLLFWCSGWVPAMDHSWNPHRAPKKKKTPSFFPPTSLHFIYMGNEAITKQ